MNTQPGVVLGTMCSLVGEDGPVFAPVWRPVSMKGESWDVSRSTNAFLDQEFLKVEHKFWRALEV